MTAILEDAQELKVSQWGTLNTAASPQKLPDGHSPNNQNVWMDEKPGSVVTANGYIKLGKLPSNLPPTFGIEFFKTSDGTSKFVVSDGQTVWWTTDYVNYTSIITGLSQYFQLRGAVIRDKLWLTNGSDSVRTWDGTSVVLLDGSGGSPTVPKGKYIAYHDERVWLYGIDGDLSSLRFTALADVSGTEITPDNASAWPADNEIQISEGDADIGTGLWLYRGYLYCSKQFSIWRIVGSDEYDYTRVKTRASTGTRFQESVQIKDNLVHFIGVDGGYTFDGEEAQRITDIIDPSSPDEGVFAFRNLQQPLLNNQFWNVSETADFAVGTAPANLSTDNDQLALIATDDTQADFTSGALTNTSATDNPGSLQLVLSDAATANIITSDISGVLSSISGQPVAIVGSGSSLVDQSTAGVCGFQSSTDSSPGSEVAFEVDLGSNRVVNKVVLAGLQLTDGLNASILSFITIEVDTTGGGTWTTVASGGPGLVSGAYGPTNQTISFTKLSIRKIRARLTFSGGRTSSSNPALNQKVNLYVTEMYVYGAGFVSSGTFVSKTLDLKAVPATFGVLAAAITANGEAYQFYTQSSNDGISWDVAVNVANGGSIGSNLKRYLRWGVALNSSTGISTPVIDSVFLGSTYLSEIHNTGGGLFQWAAFQMSQNKAGQTITSYYRAASTSGGVLAAAWTAMIPGAVPGTAITNQYIQIKLEFSTTDPTQTPSVQSFTVNWIIGTGFGINTLQNVASIVWLNRYWLTAATLGANSNDIVIVLGKATYNSPWHKKDFSILMFCRYQNILIGGSSTDGSLYRMEYGFSKNGEAMDSFYETADFSKSGFQMKGRELIITADKSGPYNLSVGWSTDGGLNYTEKLLDLTRDSGEALSVTKKFNINFMSDSVRFRVRINGADKPFSVDELLSYYRLTPQRGTIAG